MKPFNKFLFLCLHCLDMRDFHSYLRRTPVLDRLRRDSIFVPMGRGQSHNQHDSLNAELTGQWTARYCDSRLTEEGYRPARSFWLPRTSIEYLEESGFDVFSCVGYASDNMGSAACQTMKKFWLGSEPERLAQFNLPSKMNRERLVQLMRESDRFYAHAFLRETHRPWAQNEGLCALVGNPPANGWPEDAFCARRAALHCPDQFAALRRRGLEKADAIVGELLARLGDIEDLVVVVYSNHGEVFDHFRYNLPYFDNNENMIEGTSHGPYPYEVLYANMQIWMIPGMRPVSMRGTGRSIDMAPTLLDLAGVDAHGMDGSSMVPDFERGRFPERTRFAESGVASCLSMVREDGMKLVSTGIRSNSTAAQPSGPEHHSLAVFDLHTDPWEYVNLIESEHGQTVLQWAIEQHQILREARRAPC